MTCQIKYKHGNLTIKQRDREHYNAIIIESLPTLQFELRISVLDLDNDKHFFAIIILGVPPEPAFNIVDGHVKVSFALKVLKSKVRRFT